MVKYIFPFHSILTLHSDVSNYFVCTSVDHMSWIFKIGQFHQSEMVHVRWLRQCFCHKNHLMFFRSILQNLCHRFLSVRSFRRGASTMAFWWCLSVDNREAIFKCLVEQRVLCLIAIENLLYGLIMCSWSQIQTERIQRAVSPIINTTSLDFAW